MLETPMPAFTDNNIPVVFACSDVFIPHAAAAMQSLIEHSSASYNYDLIFLHTEISENNQRIMHTMVKSFSNISLRFYNIEAYVKPQKLRVHGQYRAEAFYRLLIPQLLYKYEKVIYLDSDLTILKNIAELFEIDIGNNLLGATIDLGMMTWWITDPQIKNYLENFLHLKSPNFYIQSGVLVFNIYEFNKVFAAYELLELAEKNNYMYLDQDILSAKCQGRFYPLDINWDVLIYDQNFFEPLRSFSPSLYQKYQGSKKNPYIIHHAGIVKPWYSPEIEFGEAYWEYERKTPFYEITLWRIFNRDKESEHAIADNRSAARKFADRFLPKGTFRRRIAKKILPKGSRRLQFCKKIYDFMRRQ